MTNAAPEVRVMGTLHETGGDKGAVRVEDVFDTDIHDLWSAVTDPARLARWLAKVEGDLRLGGEVTASFTSTWTGPGHIEVCEAPHRLLVRWNRGTEEETVTEADLSADGDRTRLVIHERGLPVADLAGHGAGWQAHVEDLGAEVKGRPAGDWRDRWTALVPLYQTLVSRRD
jgi:uncharacterized protein YndB with AHSA1/START domain